MKREKDLRQHVQIGGSTTHISLTSGECSVRPSRLTFEDNYALNLAQALENRKHHKVIEGKDNNLEDLTPHLLENIPMKNRFRDLNIYLRGKKLSQIYSTPSQQRLNMPPKYSIDSSASMTSQILNQALLEQDLDGEDDNLSNTIVEGIPSVPPFIKVILKRTPETVLFENRSLTVMRSTDEARKIEEDNKFYEYITTGKGRIRRTNTSETQTNDPLLKTRETNTYLMNKKTIESFVSNFDMFSTYKDVRETTDVLNLDDSSRINVTTYKIKGDQSKNIFDDHKFKLATMVTLRVLAGNAFQEEQCRFRNMNMPHPLAKSCEFQYSLRLLFRFNPLTIDRSRRSVADLAFCPGNGDILAVAYGIYSFEAMHVPESGYCCVWNIKNPVNPERIFFYSVPVVSVQFSQTLPQLLAVGLYDGSVAVQDISTFAELPVAVSQRSENSSCDPITSIEWIPQSSVHGVDTNEIDPLLALSQDGGVTKYRLINSPYLLAFKQIHLDRVEGTPEGLYTQRDWEMTQANRNPQGLSIALHPRQDDIYYVLSDEGCLHKCSTNYPHQHLEVLQVHSGGVNVMDFSPWSPKLFLTAGNDWCIRIWIDGMFTPLLTLKHDIGPIHCAAWSKTHSTIIVSNTRDAINIWDIRRSTLKPVTSVMVDKSHYTLFRFSRCGRSMAIGNERGQVLMVAFEDMPFPPHFQYEELELALHRAISTNPELTTELKSFGFFGYRDLHHAKSNHCSL